MQPWYLSRSNGRVFVEPSWSHVEVAHHRLKSIQQRFALEMAELVSGKSLLTLRALEILAGPLEQLHDQFYGSLRTVPTPKASSK